MYSTFWGGNWQVLAAVLFFPCNWIPLPPPAKPAHPFESAAFLQNAALCLLGYAPSEDPRDQLCVADGTALLWFGLYITCCTAFNVLGCWLMKSMSATWCTVGSVLCLYLTAVFASSELLMGPEARPITLELYLGLALAMLGMWQYNLSPEGLPDLQGSVAPSLQDHLSVSFKTERSGTTLCDSPLRSRAWTSPMRTSAETGRTPLVATFSPSASPAGVARRPPRGPHSRAASSFPELSVDLNTAVNQPVLHMRPCEP